MPLGKTLYLNALGVMLAMQSDDVGALLVDQQSLVAYSHANYGPEAVFRQMTDDEEADFLAPTQDSSLLVV